MSRISDVSSKLGQYMLAGWVLTDNGCPVCSIPMLRSPAGESPERMICAQCQTSPETSSAPATGGTVRRELPTLSTSSTSSTGLSGVSTPPTEVSSVLSSPTFAPPPDPQETLRRRAQSDLASAEIGRRMLRGWAMLAEECPSSSCYGVPLVRPPKPGSGKDPRKECVVCGSVFIYEKDSHGIDRLVPLNSTETPSTPQLLEAPTSTMEQTTTPDLHVPIFQPSMRSVDRGDDVLSRNSEAPPRQTHAMHSATSNISTLDTSVTSLDRALMALSRRLNALSSQEPVDHLSIGDVALGMEKVTNALRAAKQLRFQENSLHTS